MKQKITITINVTTLIKNVSRFIAEQILLTHQISESVTLAVQQGNVIIELPYGQHLIPMNYFISQC